MTSPEESEEAFQGFGLKLLKEQQKRKAAEAERDAYREECMSHRRRLGIPVERPRRRLAPSLLKQATESASDSAKEKEDGMAAKPKKDRHNEQAIDGGRLGPAEPLVKPATPSEKAAIGNDAGGDVDNVSPLGVYAIPDVESMGVYSRRKGDDK